jgi:hypothetical protein
MLFSFISDKYQKILLKENSTIVDERPEEYEFKIQTWNVIHHNDQRNITNTRDIPQGNQEQYQSRPTIFL